VGAERYANPELARIAQDIRAGRYSALEQKLFQFLQKNLPAIEQERAAWERRMHKPIEPTFAAKQLILRRKSVDARAEIDLQYDEILREAWYRGDPDHNRVACEWARKHAGGWRDHYALTLALILNEREDAFLALYANHSAPKA
jgi:hypothetical protein